MTTVFGVLLLISAPVLLVFAFASQTLEDRRHLTTRIVLTVLSLAAVVAVVMALVDLVLHLDSEASKLVRASGALAGLVLVSPFLLSLVARRPPADGT